MALTPGTRLGVYEVTGPIGAGGMGEVYRARDTKLHRDVAIKVLLPAVANDPERLARFSREAHVLASLNHPNIAHIHGLEEGGDMTALVLEFVEGDDLAQRIARGPIPLGDAVSIARQIADALEAAHDQGIVHRDLKPANIKVRADGTAKILDFGLAKAVSPTSGSAIDVTSSPTLAGATQMGVIMGTAAYMAPEQARGKAIDRRADIWAFGVVLFEMLSGRRAFAGDNLSDVLATVLKSDPEWTALPPRTPASIRRLLRRCLEKDPRKRLSAIGDARFDLDDVDAPGDEERSPTSVPVSGRMKALVAGLGVATVALVALAVPALRHLQERPPALNEIRFDVLAPQSGGSVYGLSADGRALVFRGADLRLWVRLFDSPSPHPLEGTAGARAPTFSPDGRAVAFIASATSSGWTSGSMVTAALEVRRVNLDGGPPVRIAAVKAANELSWGTDNVILAATDDGIVRIEVTGGATDVVIPAPADATIPWVRFLSDGTHFLYATAPNAERANQETYVGSLESRTGARVTVSGENPQYAEPGFVLAREGQTVYAYPFNTRASQVTGDRFAVLQGAASFRVAISGAVAFRSVSSGGLAQAAWINRAGQMIASVGPELAANAELELAPDGRRAATVRLIDGVWNLWLLETARGVLTRLTSAPTIARWPTWSPDSRRVAYGQGKDLYVIDVDGAGTPQKLLEDEFVKSSSDWSPDGRFLIYRVTPQSPGTKGDLWVLPLGGDPKPFPFVATEAEETRAQFSPDGRWVAYESDESGRLEVCVRPFQRAGGRVVISLEGGIEARWNPNGREIFFISPAGAVMSAAVRPSADGTSLEVEPARRLFQSRLQDRGLYPPNFKIDYDVSPGGDRFLMLQTTDKADAAAISVVANWRPKAIR